MEAYQLKIQIKNAKPPIWRRCLIPAGITFSQLTLLLNEIMGWSGCHLSEFEFHHLGVLIMEDADEDFGYRETVLDASETLIDDYLDAEDWFTYTYDLGDDWQHRVVIEDFVQTDENYPKVLKYKGKTPLEDCGGIYGYYEVLDILNDPEHEEYESYQEWIEDIGVNPDEEYDMDAVNRRLAHFFYCIGGKQEKRSVFELYQDYYSEKRGLHVVSDSKIKAVSFGDRQTEEFAQMEELLESELVGPVMQQMQEMDEGFHETFQAELRELYEEMERENEYYSDVEECEITLAEFLSKLNKDILVMLAREKGMRGYSRLGKEALVNKLAEFMLQTEEMRRYFSYLNEMETIHFMLRAHIGRFFHDEENNLGKLRGTGYLAQANNDRYLIPVDVAEKLWENHLFMDDDDKDDRAQKICLMMCTELAARLYGVVPVDVFITLCQRVMGEEFSEQQIIHMVEEVPREMAVMRFHNDKFYHVNLMEGFEDILEAQKDMPYYIPTEDEIEEFALCGAFVNNEAFRQFISFFSSNIRLEEEEAFILGLLVQKNFDSGFDCNDLLEELQNMGVISADKREKSQMKKQLQNLYDNTRMSMLHGFTPNEVKEREKGVSGKRGVSGKKKAAGKKVIDFPVRKE